MTVLTGATIPTAVTCLIPAFLNATINNVNIGYGAGRTTQGKNAVSIGYLAGNVNQGSSSVAIGEKAGASNQSGVGSIAIGAQAGFLGQSDYSIAIGYNAYTTTSQPANSIIISASGSYVTAAGNSSTVITPMRNVSVSAFGTPYLMMYNPDTGELGYSGSSTDSSKTFVINHPDDRDRYLVHACLEGPEAGVYYRGKGEITDGQQTVIRLPEYVVNLATDFTIQLTPISKTPVALTCSEVENNEFTVYGPNTRFFWHVHAMRNEIEVEPLKATANVNGSGPYKWIG